MDGQTAIVTGPLDDVLADLDPLIEPSGVVLIGELLGTEQFPALVELIVDRCVERSIPSIVGLELPFTEPVEAGGFGSFWDRDPAFADGRSSLAMAKLVRRLAGRRDVRPVAMDGPWVAPGSPIPLEAMGVLEQPRDDTMAHQLLGAMDRTPRAFTIVLAGAMHTRVVGGATRTLGALVRAWHPRTITLFGQASGGDAWTLTREPSSTGRHAVSDVEVEPGAIWAAEPSLTDGHHGYVNVGPVSASPPFRSSGGTAPGDPPT